MIILNHKDRKIHILEKYNAELVEQVSYLKQQLQLVSSNNVNKKIQLAEDARKKYIHLCEELEICKKEYADVTRKYKASHKDYIKQIKKL